MPTSQRFRSPFRSVSKFVLLLLGVMLIPALLLLGCYLNLVGILPLPEALSELIAWHPQAEQAMNPRPTVILPTSDGRSSQYFSFPGIRQPRTRSAQEACLSEEAEVIGVCVQGKARAYSLAALSQGPQSHVVNDMIAGCPVSVAYCNTMNCAGVFTTTSKDAPLDLGVGGWDGHKGLILHSDGVNYALKDGTNLSTPEGPPLPYQQMAHHRMTWGEWHHAHPDTDIYDGSAQQTADGG